MIREFGSFEGRQFIEVVAERGTSLEERIIHEASGCHEAYEKVPLLDWLWGKCDKGLPLLLNVALITLRRHHSMLWRQLPGVQV